MKKHKDNIYWLSDDDYHKAMWHFKSQVDNLLRETFGKYGQDAYIPGAVESIAKGAEDFALVCRGIDKPIKVK